MTMREPVVISDKGKVALSTRSRWHLVYDVLLWNSFTPDKFDDVAALLFALDKS